METTKRLERRVSEVNSGSLLAAALCKAQSEFKHALIDSSNPHFKNRYASLTAVLDAVLPVLNKNEIVVTQRLGHTDSFPFLLTTFTHISGESWTSECPLLNPKGDMQGLKSAVTYARRLSLEAMAGIGEDDDDGEGTRVGDEGVNMNKQYENRSVNRAPSSSLISEAQAKRIWAMSKSKKLSEDQIREIITSHGFDHTRDITRDSYDEVCRDIEKA